MLDKTRLLCGPRTSGSVAAMLLFAVCLGLCIESVQAAEAEGAAPWWKQQKIIFMWGQWNNARVEGTPNSWTADLPPEVFQNVGMSGATVFVEGRLYKPEHARLAHRSGLKYFATKFNCSLPHLRGRNWVQADGTEHKGGADDSSPKWKCPLDESVYRQWLVEPHLEGVREGLIDGIHTDWENYSGNGDATQPCYCDSCFAAFMKTRDAEAELPAEAKRHGVLQTRGLVDAYEENFHAKRVEMFTRIRLELQALNPDLLFSCYG